MAENKLADNVYAVLDKASAMYGRMQEENFNIFRWQELTDGPMTSPIEQIFWIACFLQAASVGNEVNQLHFVGNGKWERARGIHLTPQYQIGKYRADFLLEQIGICPEEIYRPVVIELDGYAFHDRDKRQRSYEKKRDREIQRAGFKVLHFTGSDVVGDPWRVAYEALEFIGCFVGSGRLDYDPSDPLGTGGE